MVWESAKGGQAEKGASTGGCGGDGLGSTGMMTTPMGGALVVVGPELAGRGAPCTGCVTVAPAASMIRHCPRGAGCVSVAPAASMVRHCPRRAELGSSHWGGAGSDGAGVVEELAGVSVVRKSA
jgi:hypothetical protein